MPTLGDIKSRCKITAFFAHECAVIQKKCVKIDTFEEKSRARTLFICIYEIFFVPLCPKLEGVGFLIAKAASLPTE